MLLFNLLLDGFTALDLTDVRLSLALGCALNLALLLCSGL